MYRVRRWVIQHARFFEWVYKLLESFLVLCEPIFRYIGYDKIEKPVAGIERLTKSFLFDSKMCGMCILSSTGMACPMNCPKELRNGPCGGVRPDGKCEVEPDMDCVWMLAWEGNKRLGVADYPIQVVQPPVDNRLRNTSAWLREVRRRTGADETKAQT